MSKKRKTKRSWSDCEQSNSDDLSSMNSRSTIDYGKKAERRFADTDDSDLISRNVCHKCSSYSLLNFLQQSDDDLFKNLDVGYDAAPEKMKARKWALALGRFKILDVTDATGLEDTREFKASVTFGRPNGKVPYVTVPCGYSPEELDRSSHSCIVLRKTKYTNLKAKFPGSGQRFHVVWSAPNGDIHVDRLVKLYDLKSIHCHQIEVDCRGPKSPWFGLVDPKEIPTPDRKIHFDANMFWTVGLLYKHFDTSGVESWDAQLDEMKRTASVTDHVSRPPPVILRPESSLDHVTKAVPFTAPLAYTPAPLGHLHPTNSSAEVYQPFREWSAAPPTSTSHETSLRPPPFMPQPSWPPPAVSQPLNVTPEMQQSHFHPSPKVNGRYTGCIVLWKTNYGFLACDLIPGSVFLHQSDITNLHEGYTVEAGLSVSFCLREDPRGYRAFNAKLFM